MQQYLTTAGLCHDQAERMHVLALGESDEKRRRVLFLIADHYFQLHDHLVELEQSTPAPACPVCHAGVQAG